MELNVKDLRIGNLLYGVSDRIETIIGIEDNGMIKSFVGNMNKGFANIEITDFSGISVTYDNLIKMGFKQLENYNEGVLGLNGFRMCEHLGEWQWNDFSRNKKVKYIHELQNLYFALTNEELNVKF